MRTKQESRVETLVHTVVGYLTAVVIQYLVYPLYGWSVDWWDNSQIAIIFMVVSAFRHYVLSRMLTRYFNWRRKRRSLWKQ